ncbi:MAG: 30S ribosomal protein S20 [Pseudomonadota bacterium]|nr:30S ribosomal protein S20 [Magnetococcales bacterium]MEC8067718.1 30S ribosomal protein S20 [Pseudomonadota bacterium]MEC8466894.1 30S ribosomal protein S20 [Pseudomonadota bacterium]|tara:strand:+ start:516 stop:782 length:267 start_codon:yes stop_codon:yes gene_type:complete
MATHQQAKKRIRQTARITERNRAARSTMRSSIKALETAIEAGDKDKIGQTFTTAMANLHKAASKGLIKKETASRKISRLSARVKGLSA